MTGEGRAFCAGADLGGFAQRIVENEGTAPAPRPPRGNLDHRFLRRSKPTVAAINGYAAGVGLTFILPLRHPHRLDQRAAQHPLHQDGADAGARLHPAAGADRRPRQRHRHVPDRALRAADEALRMGLVAVSPPEQLMETALAKANEIANNPTGAVMMDQGTAGQEPARPGPGARDGARADAGRDRAGAPPDHREAVTAFREKREARFNQA